MSTASVDGENPRVEVERVDALAILTLNRPEVLNAIDAATADQLGAALDAAASDVTVRAIIITGAGRAFCAGMDLRAFARGERAMSAKHPEWGWAGIMRQEVAVPVIAAVHGVALGLGAELALAADIIVAEGDARFGFPEVTVGLMAAAGGAFRAAQSLPPKLGMEMLLTGEPVTALELQSFGLIRRIAPAGEALHTAIELGRTIARNAPVAVAETKRVAVEGRHLEAHGDTAWRVSAEAERSVFGTWDAREGVTAFLEHRPAHWRGA